MSSTAGLGNRARRQTARKTARAVCAAAGCDVTPRRHPRFCHRHRHLEDVEAAERAGELAARSSALAERAELADREGRSWAARAGGTDSSWRADPEGVVPVTAVVLASIEAEASEVPSREAAAWAWHNASAVATHLAAAKARVAERAGQYFGPGEYRSSDGRAWKIDQKTSERWARSEMLAEVDARIGADASPDEYVAALRDAMSFTAYSPWRLRSIMPEGDIETAFESVTYGPAGLRPLDPDRDKNILGSDSVRADWADAWSAAKDRCKGIAPVPSPEHGPTPLMDVLSAIGVAQALARDEIKKWEARAAYDRRPGELLRDEVGTPVAKVVPSVETRGPRHDRVDAALAALGDRQKILEAVVTVSSGGPNGKKRGLKALGLDPGFFIDADTKWRARPAGPHSDG